MKKIIALGAVLSSMPLFALAQTSEGSIGTILSTLISYLNFIVPALVTLAVVYFIWGVITFIGSSDEEAKKNGRAKIINGLIGLFVIVAFWGIIGLVQNTFGIGNRTGGDILPCTPNTTNRMGLDC